ncbi:MAG: alpha/beta hydrolase, partial [Thermomicrobiales bacterium]
PDPFHDAQRAVRWLRTNAGRLGIDPEAIVSYGHSAGGHLAALLAVRDDASDPGAPSSRVNGCVAIAEHMDLHIPYDDAFARSSMNALLDGDPDAVPDRATDASPIAWVDAASSPFLLLHGAADHQVSPRHHQTMATALQAAGVAVTVVTVPAADHFTIAAWECAGPWALAFVDTVAAHATNQRHPEDAP